MQMHSDQGSEGAAGTKSLRQPASLPVFLFC